MKPVEIVRLGLAVCLGLSCLSLPATAAPRQNDLPDPTTSRHDPTSGRNDPTRGRNDVAALLELQRSGRLASPHRQTLPGDAQTRAWERYLESFSHPIPARYIDEKFKSK